MCDVKSRGCRKLMKRDTKVTHQQSQLIYVGGNMVKETVGQDFLLATSKYYYLLWTCIILVQPLLLFLSPSDKVSYMIWSDINRISSSTPVSSF